jgi:Fe-S oxidoreductase
VLKKAGYTLYLIRKEEGEHCCGRTFLSAGMVGKARQKLAGAAEGCSSLGPRWRSDRGA